MRLRLKTIEPLPRLLENQSSILWIRKPKKVGMLRELLCQPSESYLSPKPPPPPSNYGKYKKRRKTFDWNIWIIGMLAFLKLAPEGQWMPLYHLVPRLLPLLMVETSKSYLPLLEVLPNIHWQQWFVYHNLERTWLCCSGSSNGLVRWFNRR